MRIAIGMVVAPAVMALAACAAKPASSTASSGGSPGFGMYCSGTKYKPCHSEQQACEEADQTECLWIDDLWCHAANPGQICYTSQEECADWGDDCYRRGPS